MTEVSPYLERSVAQDDYRSTTQIVSDIVEITQELRRLAEKAKLERPLQWVLVPQTEAEQLALLKTMALFEQIEGREEEWIEDNA